MRKINSIGYADRIIGLATIFWRINHNLFSVLLVIEFQQDKRINKYHEDNKNVKILLGNGLYECQACGVHFKD